MLGNAAPTPYDLRFSLFGIPVRVHPLFWLVGVLFGWDAADFNLTLIWVGCCFVSILVHELGHALSAQAFGWPPEIVLYALGGFATFVPTWGYTLLRAIAVLLAGPGAGFLLFGLVNALVKMMELNGTTPNYYTGVMFANLVFINLWWGLVNLLPVYPLDGGQISRELFTHWQGRRGVTNSLRLSLISGVGVALLAYTSGQTYAAILFAVLAIESFQALQQDRF
jgi:Zn-dependent protease